MSYKYAVLIYGEYREFDIAIQKWDFLKLIDHDIFVSTWDYSKQENTKLDINREFKVTEDMITKYLPTAKVEILNEEAHRNLFYKNFDRMVFHWKNVLKMALLNKVKYDFIMLLRTDLVYYLDQTHIDQFDTKFNGLYIENQIFEDDGFAHDFFFVAKTNVMTRFILNHKQYDTKPHFDTGKHIMDLGLATHSLALKIQETVRPNCRGIELKNLTRQVLLKKYWEWDDGFIKNNKDLNTFFND